MFHNYLNTESTDDHKSTPKIKKQCIFFLSVEFLGLLYNAVGRKFAE